MNYTTGRRERTSGMLMSSMKNVILLPFGGPKFLPPLLSSSASTAFCAPNLRCAVVDARRVHLSTRSEPAQNQK